MSYSGKEVQLLLKIIGVMKKIIVFNSEKIRQGWLNQSIGKPSPHIVMATQQENYW